MREADASRYVDKVGGHRPQRTNEPVTTRSRSRERGIALASQRRGAQAAVAPRVARRRTTSAPSVDNLRTWCDTWTKRGGHGLSGTASETVQRIVNMAREQLEMELVWLSRLVNGRQVFEAFAGDPNDMVVPTAGVGGANGTFQVSPSAGVYHLGYFQNPDVQRKIRECLAPPPAPGQGPRP